MTHPTRHVAFTGSCCSGLLLLICGLTSPAAAETEWEFSIAEVPVAAAGYGSGNSGFGAGLILHDQRLVMAGNDGRVLVFDYSDEDSTFIQVLNLIERDINNQGFTTRLAVSGEFLLASVVGLGAAQVIAYHWQGESYVEHHVLESPVFGHSGRFGAALTVSDHYVMVGEPNAGNGVVWVYSPLPELELAGSIAGDASLAEMGFGAGLAATHDLLVVAAPGDWFAGPGLARIYALNGTGTGDDFENHVDIQSSWFDFGRNISIHDGRIFASGFLFGDSFQSIYRIGVYEEEAGQWGLHEILEAGQGPYYEQSLHNEFIVNDTGLYTLRFEDSGSGDMDILEWINWPIISGAISADPVILGDRESLALPELVEQGRLGGLLVDDGTVLLGDRHRGYRSSGGATRAVIVNQQLERRPDITPPRTAFARWLGASLAAGTDFLAIGAPGWCRVYLLRQGEHPPAAIESPVDDEDCGLFGRAVAVHDEYLVIGAPQLTHSEVQPGAPWHSAIEAGAVYVMDINSGSVIQILMPPAPEWRGRFGSQVVTHGDRLLVRSSSEVAVYQRLDSDYTLTQVIPVFAFGISQAHAVDMFGDLVVFAAYSSAGGSVQVMAWNGTSYDPRGAAIDDWSGQFGSGVLLVSANRLLVSEPEADSLRDYRFNGEEWNEAESLWGHHPGFGTTLARTPCGTLIADFNGLTRFNQIGDMPDKGLRLGYEEFDLFPWGTSEVNLIHSGGKDYMAAYQFDGAERFEGRLFTIGARKGIFQSRFEQQLCSF